MEFVNVRDLHNRTSEILRRAKDGKLVFITQRGKPIAVLRGLTEEELEDFLLSYHPRFRKAVEKAVKEAKAGKTVPLEKALQEDLASPSH
jgi:prevent-host-death family protein